MSGLQHFLNIRIEEIEESPLNPRKVFDESELDELADSIREQGVLEPVIVRPRVLDTRPTGVFFPYQIVCGARRLRAARRAGLPTIPAIVRNLDDAQVVEVQVVENVQRASMTPLEEAHAFDAMLAGECSRVEEVAVRVGRTVGYVRSRLRLLDLEEPAKKLLEEGTIAIESALLIAQAPAVQQREVAATIARGSWRVRAGLPWTRLAVADLIRSASRQLHLAVWRGPDGTGDIEGQPECATCPKRTGTQRSLLAELDGQDTCLDPECWQAKETAFADAWRGEGKRVVDTADRYALRGRRAWTLDDSPDGLPGASPDDGTVADYLARLGIDECGKSLLVPRTGGSLELVITALDVKTALDVAHPELAEELAADCAAQVELAATHGAPPARTSAPTQPSEEAVERAEAKKRELALTARVHAEAQERIGAMVAEAATEAWPPKTAIDEVAWWAGICRAVLGVTSYTARERVTKRRSLPRDEGGVFGAEQAVEAFIATTLDVPTLRGLAAELLVSTAHIESLATGTEPLFGVPALLGALGIVPRQVVLGVRRELEREEASASTKAVKRASKKARRERDALEGGAQ